MLAIETSAISNRHCRNWMAVFRNRSPGSATAWLSSVSGQCRMSCIPTCLSSSTSGLPLRLEFPLRVSSPVGKELRSGSTFGKVSTLSRPAAPCLYPSGAGITAKHHPSICGRAAPLVGCRQTTRRRRELRVSDQGVRIRPQRQLLESRGLGLLSTWRWSEVRVSPWQSGGRCASRRGDWELKVRILTEVSDDGQAKGPVG